jgi:acyl-CoA synthetase (AMP-forming)/AMP-acid ligase II
VLETNALFAPGRQPLTHAELHTHVARVAAAIRRRGFRRDDIIALILPNGPEMATAFLSVCSAAVCAPLNPVYRADELEFYLTDLPARALIIGGLTESPAREVARRIGIPIIELSWSENDTAGIFRLGKLGPGDATDSIEAPRESDIALVLHTSGTTSRPKIVPLTHGNLSVSARHVASSLELTSTDRCLNVMPLFHIHGLVAALLASLEVEGSVVCAPGFLATAFLDWVAEFQPTWYTAVPTMHASIIARAKADRATVDSRELRFIRSSSAALPRQILTELEEIFRVPVVEAYGMTEAAHQIASNPLPPGARKPGTVGRAAGPSISVLDIDGRSVAPGTRGEIAIKGPNVTAGYARNPEANAAAFTSDGWLRTGDEGMLDDDGYLTILGRQKEMINRGGEKVSPLEVDAILSSHPAVGQAVTFGAPDAALGEEVAAAVILREGMTVTERQLREFVAIRLSHFKVPRRVLFVESIPTGPTGKLKRAGLAERLGVSFDAPRAAIDKFVPPRTPVEEILAQVWMSILEAKTPGITDNFFYAGGDSILAAQFIARVSDTLGVELSMLSFFDSPTIDGLARVVEEAIAETSIA